MDGTATWTPTSGYWAAAQDPEAGCTGSTTRRRSATGTSTSRRCRWCWPPSRSTRSVATGWRCCCRCSGSVAAAFAARAIARRVGRKGRVDRVLGRRPGVARWTIYALDFWEHSIGVALHGVGRRGALRRRRHDRPTWWRGLAAGAAFGAAFAMRTEALAYGFAMVGRRPAWCCWLGRRPGRGRPDRSHRGGRARGMFLGQRRARDRRARHHVPLGAGQRSGRRGGGEVGLRIKEALVTALSPVPSVDAESSCSASASPLALGYLVWCSWKRRERTLSVVVAGLVGFIYLYRFSSGLGVRPRPGGHHAPGRRRRGARVEPVPSQAVPGLRPGAAAAGVLLPVPRGRARRSGPAGTSSRRARSWPRWASPACPGSSSGCAGSCSRSSVAVTVFGLAWLSVRSHQVAHGRRRAREPDPRPC